MVTAQNMRVDAAAHRGPHQKHTSQQSELRLFNANRLYRLCVAEIQFKKKPPVTDRGLNEQLD